MRRLTPGVVVASLAAMALLGGCVPEESAQSAPTAAPALDLAIAFVSDRTGDDELYLTDVAGSAVQRLTESAGFDRAPSWSSDGTKLVFNSRREPHNTQPEMYVLNVADRAATRVTFDDLEDQRGTFVPGDGAIVSQRGNFSLGWSIVQTDLVTGTATTLLSNPGYWAAAPQISPDGETLLLQSNHESSGIFPFRLYVMDLDSGVVEALAHAEAGSDDGPRWSPDGASVAFSSSRDDDGSHLYVVNVASGALEQVTFGGVYDSAPSWSPDGSKLVFQSDRVVEDGGIHIVDLATGTVSFVGEGRTPAWSPS